MYLFSINIDVFFLETSKCEVDKSWYLIGITILSNERLFERNKAKS